MPNEIQQKDITAILWADTTDYSSTISGLARTAQIDLTSLGAGAARQGVKVDLGANRYEEYDVFVGIEAATAFTSGEIVSFYLGESSSATAGNANPGGLSGTDAAYTGTAGDSLADSLKQLKFMGALIGTADATTTVMYQRVGTLFTPMRYVMPVAFNESAADALVADAVEMFIALLPRTPEVQ